MKTIATFIICLFATAAIAAPVTTKFSFQPISSATQVTCGVFGMKKSLPLGDNGVGQVFSPDPAMSRSLNLGTKTMRNYSTNRTTGETMAIHFTCVQTGTTNPISVKMGMNGSETYFLTLDQGTFGVK